MLHNQLSNRITKAQTKQMYHSRHKILHIADKILDSQESIHFWRHSQKKVQWRSKDYERTDNNMEKYGRVDEQQNEKSSKHMTTNLTL